MANKDSAFGCRPVRYMSGAPWSGGQSRYRIASGATTPIYQGDLVTQLTAGVIGRHAATGTVPIVGVFNGVQYTDPTTGEQVFKNYYPGSIAASDIIASVVDDPNVVFEVQADDTFPVADLFGNFDIVDGSPVGDTKSGISNLETQKRNVPTRWLVQLWIKACLTYHRCTVVKYLCITLTSMLVKLT